MAPFDTALLDRLMHDTSHDVLLANAHHNDQYINCGNSTTY